jgi:hypothetical protein
MLLPVEPRILEMSTVLSKVWRDHHQSSSSSSSTFPVSPQPIRNVRAKVITPEGDVQLAPEVSTDQPTDSLDQSWKEVISWDLDWYLNSSAFFSEVPGGSRVALPVSQNQ